MTEELLLFAIKILYIYVIGLVLAVVEIQIEGRDGWAANLPAWKPTPGSRTHTIVHTLTKKDLTGYHISLFALLLLFFHLPFIWTGTWSLMAEFEALAFFFLFAVVWDYLWFVLNPHYSVADFNPKTVWWHRLWIFGWPADYFIGVMIASIFFIPNILSSGTQGWIELALFLGINGVLTWLIILFYPHSNGKPSAELPTSGRPE